MEYGMTRFENRTTYLMSIEVDRPAAEHVVAYGPPEMEEVFTVAERDALSRGLAVEKGGLRYIDMVVAARGAMSAR